MSLAKISPLILINFELISKLGLLTSIDFNWIYRNGDLI